MREYLLGIIAVGVVCAVSLSVSHENMRGATRCALGILMLISVAAPILSVVQGITASVPELPKYDGISPEGGYEAVSEEAFCEGIRMAVASEFGLDEKAVQVDCHGFDFESMRAKWIYVNLINMPNADFRRIEEYCRTNFTKGGGCRVEFVLG